ncbi:MAG: type II CAAX prenyl endopeptidase Rce1 family protein [Sphaerospermopsis kisseleviana]|uniref:CPBP family glutamic-type intramembrane protease n=1 Tax=unclassified Sphaerospermopsis TaxID=2646443 RepID=UPI001681A574|nr:MULTISPECIES: CPBP family glutamic-type intramembrane protease [unclassified Sphaerospermopsis]MBD2131844.1 CPBP family intramembrane metalloprotease [Sphaerospermopsis sp. FACHB-1094]MBD2143963.1 CPBP family intramembrane metalloprotease [Sphaerospermopsis sp. FACHB-1194]
MSLKRLLLTALTLLAIMLSGLSLFASWQKPQFQSRLELYQTNIVLQAQAWQPEDSNDESFQALRAAIVGDKPLESAAKQYLEARESVKTNLDKTKNQLDKLRAQDITAVTPAKPLPNEPLETKTSPQQQQKELEKSISKLQKLRDELDLRLGILQAQQGETDKAQKTWSQVQEPSETEFTATANVLSGLWSNPPRLLPNAQPLIQKNLEGWFRSTALTQLYQLQQRQAALADVQAAQQAAATDAVLKLALIATIPSLTAFIGLILLIALIIQLLLKGRESILATNAQKPWSTPWNVETILQVFVLGFFLMGQLFIPELLTLLPISRSSDNVRVQAFSVLVSYVMVALGAFSVLYFSIKRYFPLPEDWFRFRFFSNWFFWGLGGYCTALPIVVIVSLINQQLWNGQGGSNPLLQLALESRDDVALGIFFFTAAIAAPFFEEFLFRGFLLPSLTRYLPVWSAIFLSSLLFAAAHLSLSEILPLTALGMVLGIVYTRSRNLLAPMLLHGLWNSGTLLSLFLLGSNN